MGYTKRTHWLYFWKTACLIMYTNCIHKVFFSRLLIYDSHIYAFSHITFPLSQSLADACLWVVSLRGGPVYSRSLKLLIHT